MTIIAFMGGDGSGKTTIAKIVVEQLRSIGLSVEYSKPFEEYFILRYLLKALGRTRGILRKQFNTRGGSKPFYFSLWPYLVLLDQFIFYLYLKKFKNKKIVICDRYAYNFLISWKYYGISNRLIEWLYGHFPRPDIGLIFFVSPEIARERKKGDEYHAYATNSDEFFFEFHGNENALLAKTHLFKMIDTEQTISSTVTVTINEIKKYYLNKNDKEDNILLLISNPIQLQTFSQLYDENVVLDKIDIDYLTNFSAKNNIEYLFFTHLKNYPPVIANVNAMKTIQTILNHCARYQKKIKKTLHFIHTVFLEHNIDYIIIKTLAPYTFVSPDIDVLVSKRDYERTKTLLKSLNLNEEIEVMHNSLVYEGRTDLLQIDLHYEITWFKQKYLDENIILKRKILRNFMGIDVYVPTNEDEILILMAHSLVQHHYTTLNEFYHITSLLQNIDEDYIVQHIEEYRWDDFNKLFSLIALNHDFLFNTKFRKTYSRLCIYRYIEPSLTPLYFHPFHLIHKKNPVLIFDLLLTILRRIRYNINGELPYNINWLKLKPQKTFE